MSVRGCREPGEYRAPLTPGDFDGPGSWRWLCLDHVREHNAKYNFFAGMTPDEIEAAQRLWVDIGTLLPHRYQFTYAFPGYGDYEYQLTIRP